MSKKNEPFTFPGADPLEADPAEKLDMSFMEPSAEQVAAAEAAAQRKAAREQEEADEKARLEEEAKAKAAAEDKTDSAAAEAKKPVAEELSDEEKAEAAKVEASREEAGKKKQPMVPKTRLDEVLAKNRELAAQIEQERQAREAAKPKPKEGETAQTAFDFQAKEKAYMQAVRDGEDDKALTIRDEIRKAERQAMAQTSEESSSQHSEAVALARAAKIIEENFPQFTPGHEKFNEAATKEVCEMRDAMIMQGKNPVEALQKAVKFVVKEYDLDEEIKPSNVVDLDAEKLKKDTAKKIAAAKATPPDIKGEGNRTKVEEKNEVKDMSDEEFNALPEATKRRMRGDFA